ncbi:MAG: VWA domain-containing protein [Gammaproteobacteria bacterium]|nr:VWA domain-containing protein [Gammaproteobacteria bacterium]
MIEQFHFLRPEWLLALFPLLLINWLLFHRKIFSRNWQSVIEPQLLTHLLVDKPATKTRLPLIIFSLTGLLTIISLAGPAWQQLPQPVYKQQSGLVIALDLSQSMNAADIKPSRLSRARYKITDILNQRKEGQTALIAYAASAFTVTPLTDDTNTIAAMIPSLSTDIMPAQGSDTSAALNKASELLSNAGINKGDIFLITDGVDDSASDMIQQLSAQGHRISILAIGTEEGAPIALSTGGFLKDNRGAIVIPRLDSSALRMIAVNAGGRFSLLTSDDRDIKYLLQPLETTGLNTQATDTDLQADIWREEGPWLLLLIIPLAALAFRRGYLVLLAFIVLPYPDNAHALSWDQLWKTDNQNASQLFQQGQHQQAAELFNNPEWKAAAHYKAGDYQQAIDQLQNLDHADAHYNRANALAKLGQTQQAIDAYNQALQLNPEHEDARYNKELLEQQEQQNNEQQQPGDPSDEKQDSSSDESSDKDASSSDSQDQQSDNTDNKDNQSQSEQQSKDNQQDNKNKQSDAETSKDKQSDNQQQTAQQQQESLSEEEELSEQASQQWLRKIPDQPGELLRRKFKYQYNNQQPASRPSEPW